MEKEVIKKQCPICREEREFIHIVEAHREMEPFTMHTPIGSPLRTWVQSTSHPTAYCPVCSIVIYIGPSAEELIQEFKEEQEEAKRKKQEEFDRQFKKTYGKQIKKKK